MWLLTRVFTRFANWFEKKMGKNCFTLMRIATVLNFTVPAVRLFFPLIENERVLYNVLAMISCSVAYAISYVVEANVKKGDQDNSLTKWFQFFRILFLPFCVFNLVLAILGFALGAQLFGLVTAFREITELSAIYLFCCTPLGRPVEDD